ncbi:MAG TPA: hypothetical protein VFC74_10865 [Oscillospiraceae bacterium]|nr:hypothetical protein [Oscillospiraceae bacterium]
MSERKIKTPELEVSLDLPNWAYSPLLEELYQLRLNTELTNEEKTAKLQSILHTMLKDDQDAEE